MTYLKLKNGDTTANDVKSALDRLFEEAAILTLAVIHNGIPWVNNAFYSVGSEFDLYIISEVGSIHGGELLQGDAKVAFSVFGAQATWGPGNLRGVQATGTGFRASGSVLEGAWNSYRSRFPAVTRYFADSSDFTGNSDSAIYVLRINSFKLLYEQVFGDENYIKGDIVR